MAAMEGTGSTANVPPMQIQIHRWGELRTGTKAQLQAAGFGVGLAFPGEPGAKPKQITITDPFGFKCRLSRDSDGLYEARSEYWTDENKSRAVLGPEALPEFVQERNRRAVAAGLQITKMAVADTWCTHWYEGTAAQILEAGFRPRARRPSLRKHPIANQVQTFSPGADYGYAWASVKHLLPDYHRVVVANEAFPTKIRPVAQGVHSGEHRDEFKAAQVRYWGTIDALRASRLVPSELLEGDDDCLYLHGTPEGLESVVWHISESIDGIHVVTNFIEAKARLGARKLAEHRKRRPELADAAAYRERLLRNIEFAEWSLTRSIETADDVTYSLEQDALNAIEIAIQTIRGTIESGVVTIKTPHLAQVCEQAVDLARKDTHLQSFLSRLASS